MLAKTIAKIEEEEIQAAKRGSVGTCSASSKTPVLVLTGCIDARSMLLLNYILNEQKEKKL